MDKEECGDAKVKEAGTEPAVVAATVVTFVWEMSKITLSTLQISENWRY